MVHSTVEMGTNELVADDLDRAYRLVEQITRGVWKKGMVPPLWDGHAAERVVDGIEMFLERWEGPAPAAA